MFVTVFEKQLTVNEGWRLFQEQKTDATVLSLRTFERYYEAWLKDHKITIRNDEKPITQSHQYRNKSQR